MYTCRPDLLNSFRYKTSTGFLPFTLSTPLILILHAVYLPAFLNVTPTLPDPAGMLRRGGRRGERATRLIRLSTVW